MTVNNNSDNMIQTLLGGFRAFNIDAKPPKFVESQNPKKFLEKLEKFFNIKIIPYENHMDVLDDVFCDRAKIWFESHSYVDYQDFKQKFIEEFYSIPVRVRMKADWLAKRFDPSKDQLSAYFFSQIKDAQYFLPSLKNCELHYTVI